MEMSMNFSCLTLNWIYLLLDSLSSYVYLKDIYKTLKGMDCFRVTNFVRSPNFTGVFTKKKIGIIKAWIQLLMWESQI